MGGVSQAPEGCAACAPALVDVTGQRPGSGVAGTTIVRHYCPSFSVGRPDLISKSLISFAR
jgi:hypothetical protein